MSCKNCEDRSFKCHSKCERYALYKKKLEQASINKRNYYLTPRAGFELSLKSRVRSNKPLGNMRIY